MLSQGLGLDDFDLVFPSKQLPGHFGLAAGLERHGHRPVRIGPDFLARMEPEAPDVFGSVGGKQQFDVENLFLEYAETLIRMLGEVKLAPPHERAVRNFDTTDIHEGKRPGSSIGWAVCRKRHQVMPPAIQDTMRLDRSAHVSPAYPPVVIELDDLVGQDRLRQSP